jgi:hypothetical protein
LHDNGEHSKKYWLRWLYARTVRRRLLDGVIWAFVINASSCVTVQNIARQWLIQRKTDGLLGKILLYDIQYNIINKACNRGVHWKMSSLEFHCWPRLTPRSTVEFSGWHFPIYPSIAGIIYIIYWIFCLLQPSGWYGAPRADMPCDMGFSMYYSLCNTQQYSLRWSLTKFEYFDIPVDAASSSFLAPCPTQHKV